jgi:hypothetical protein
VFGVPAHGDYHIHIDIDIAKGRRQKAQGFYVYYWYVVVSAVRAVLTFMATARTP